jgi:hypothetical protein
MQLLRWKLGKEKWDEWYAETIRLGISIEGLPWKVEELPWNIINDLKRNDYRSFAQWTQEKARRP